MQLARRKVLSARTAADLPVDELRAEMARLIAAQPAARVDYISFFDPDTLNPCERVTRGTHLALAVFIGRTRLIDNARL